MRIARHRRASTIPAAAVSASNVKSPSKESEKGKNIYKSESIAVRSVFFVEGGVEYKLYRIIEFI